MGTKLLNRLAKLGLTVDPTELEETMKNRPKRDYRKPADNEHTTSAVESWLDTTASPGTKTPQKQQPSEAGTNTAWFDGDADEPSTDPETVRQKPSQVLELDQHHQEDSELEANGGVPLFESADAKPIISETGEMNMDDDPHNIDPWCVSEKDSIIPGDEKKKDIPFTYRNVPAAVPSSSMASSSPLFVGQPCRPGETFCPLVVISKLPYKFMNNQKDLAQRIASDFFDGGKIWMRDWTVHYIWPVANTSKALCLVPTREVETLFSEVNATFRSANLSLSRLRQRFPGMTIKFRSQHAQLRPRFLGICHDQERFHHLQSIMPSSSYHMPGEHESIPLSGDNLEVQEYDTQIFQAIDLGGNKKKGASRHARPEVREQYRAAVETDFRRQLHQVERFLGLRPARISVDDNNHFGDDADARLSWDEVQARLDASKLASDPIAIDAKEAAPYQFDSDVIFICFDVESYERDHSKITEIGICTLDTNNLNGIAPGEWAKEWYSKIRAQHFRIRDHVHLRNGEFVVDHAANFKFGESEFIPLSEAPQTIARCFRHTSTETGTSRRLVLVGHDVDQDIRYLLRMGYDVSNLGSLHPRYPKIDTQNLYRALQKQNNPTSDVVLNPVKLAVIMEEMDIAPFGLHNAGNDAVYTLQVMLGMAVGNAVRRGRQLRKSDGSIAAFHKEEQEEIGLVDDPLLQTTHEDDGLIWD